MKIFEFKNAFILLDEIRVAYFDDVEPKDGNISVDSDEENSKKWYVRIIYRDESSFKSSFSSESDARKAYIRLMNAVREYEDV